MKWRCPSCQRLNDDLTDGLHCPSCGAASLDHSHEGCVKCEATRAAGDTPRGIE